MPVHPLTRGTQGAGAWSRQGSILSSALRGTRVERTKTLPYLPSEKASLLPQGLSPAPPSPGDPSEALLAVSLPEREPPLIA